jgi:membrane carboxypeptidase/penicillin-binding protein
MSATEPLLSPGLKPENFDVTEDGNVNVTLASRQPGSSIKPLVYATAFERRLLTPSSILTDKPTCFLQPDQKDYCPQNYDNQFHGPTQARFALGNSFNIPAVKTLVINGLSDFIASASAYGISGWKNASDYGPSLALGGGEVSMMELSTAYGVFANQGQRVDLNPLLRVQNQFGKILYEVPSHEISSSASAKLTSTQFYSVNNKPYQITAVPNTRVISPDTAFLISHILYDNSARAATFGTSSYLNIRNHPEVSVKTGTTNDKRDNWTIGYNPDLLTAVWVGNNDNTPMSAIASGVTGASPIWNKIMTYVLTDLPQSWPIRPADVVGTTVCSLSGFKSPDTPEEDCSPRYEYFLAQTVPSVDFSHRRDIPIFRPTQTPASTRQLLENPGDIEYQNHAVLFDSLNTFLCLDCPGGYGPADSIRLDRSGRAMK